MIRKNTPKGILVYNDGLGLFGTTTGNTNPKNANLIEIEFSEFFQYCHRKDLTEIEN